jgi:outer membrane protein assembly factor BamB
MSNRYINVSEDSNLKKPAELLYKILIVLFFFLIILFSDALAGSKIHKRSSNNFNKKSSSYNWLQFNFDPQHSGNDIKESKIIPKNVSKLHQLFKIALPSSADGTPVYLSSVKTNSGLIDLIFLTTRDGHILALNAKNGKTIWSHQYGSGNYRINNGDQKTYTTSSPVIDPNRNFVYSYGLDGYVHKYKVNDGKEIKKEGWPELCTRKPFDEKGSSALAFAALKDGSTYLYAASGGYLGDRGDYQGHVTSINLNDGSQHVFNAAGSSQPLHFVEKPGNPDWPSVQSAVWARAGVVYDDAANRIYFATGNGKFNPDKHDWGDAVLALNPNGTGINGGPLDSYTPANYQDLDNYDLDLGSTAPAIIPVPKNCLVKNLGVQSGKDKKLRLINLANLNGHNRPGITGGEIGKVIEIPSDEMVFTAPAVWVNPKDKTSWIFIGTYSGLSAFKLHIDKSGNPSLKVEWNQSDGSSSPIIANNILYCAVSGSIRALDPVTGKLLWQNKDIGQIHWESPIVDNGILYITDESKNLTAFGL